MLMFCNVVIRLPEQSPEGEFNDEKVTKTKLGLWRHSLSEKRDSGMSIDFNAKLHSDVVAVEGDGWMARFWTAKCDVVVLPLVEAIL